MKTYNNYKKYPLSKGFTLIEIMIVVVVIAILAGMLFPAVIGARKRAKKKQAMVDACEIVHAIKLYEGEYQKWPDLNSSSSDRAFGGNLGSDRIYFTDNYKIINVLMGQNSRSNIYLSPNTNRFDSDTNYLDPWGIPFVIVFDDNYSGEFNCTFTNVVYTNQHTGQTNSYTATIKHSTEIGFAAISFGTTNYMDEHTSNLVVYSWYEIQ
jgi:prepilin-type N-terminal cleavage/methylation domain-containing protein